MKSSNGTKKYGRNKGSAKMLRYNNENRANKNKAKRVIKDVNRSRNPETTLEKIFPFLDANTQVYVKKYAGN